MKLTDKQRAALHATALPLTVEGRLWWAYARGNWQGPRQTLGSLIRHGLVSYHPLAGWDVTDAGLAELGLKREQVESFSGTYLQVSE